MQPNQQDPSQQPYVPPVQSPLQPQPDQQPYRVPEYLHLDPVADPTVERHKRKKKIQRIGLALLVILTIVSVGLFALWYSDYSSPQQKFYRALEDSLKVTYVEREYTATYQGPVYNSKLQADTKTDFTELTVPKSSVNYRFSRTTPEDGAATHEVDYVMPGKDTYMAIVRGKIDGSLVSEITANQWYQMKFRATSMDTVDYYLDQLPQRQMFNTTQGLLPMGSFSPDQRLRLMDYIKTHNVYVMTKNKTQQSATSYTVTLNIDALNGLNKEVATMLGIKPIYIASRYLSGTSEFTILVDDRSGRIKQTNYTIPSKDTFRFQGIVDYSYPTSVSIAVPSNAKSLPEGVSL